MVTFRPGGHVTAEDREQSAAISVTPKREDVTELSRLLRADRVDEARKFVCGFAERGATHDTILLDLLGAAATQVGEAWADDRCTFCDVTLFLSRLQFLAHALTRDVPRRPVRRRGQLVVLVAAPGEQHIFGLSLLDELLRGAGWDVLDESPETLVDVVRSRHVDVLALTACRVERLEELTRMVASARAASRNRHLKVIVGGRCFDDYPELVGEVGASATAPTPVEALLVIRDLIESTARVEG